MGQLFFYNQSCFVGVDINTHFDEVIYLNANNHLDGKGI